MQGGIMNREDRYRFMQSKGKFFDRFDARLMGKTILRVEIAYEQDGSGIVKYVDVICERKK